MPSRGHAVWSQDQASMATDPDNIPNQDTTP